MLEFVAREIGKAKVAGSAVTTLLVESGTGSGKTAIEYAIPKAVESCGGKTLFLITPNKTLVDQIKQEFPDLKVALGRNEHPCLYYEDEFRADEIPCSFLQDCPHRVNQASGQTHQAGAVPCPYLQQKFEAKQGGVVVATDSFFLFTRLFSQEFEEPDCLVIDEAHRLADVVRNSLSYEITDYHLRQLVELLRRIKSSEARKLRAFLKIMREIAKSKPAKKQVLLADKEIDRLINALSAIDSKQVLADTKAAIASGLIDRHGDRSKLKRLEMVARDLRRYIHSLEYCTTAKSDNPLNYVCAFYEEERPEGKRVQHKLVIKCFCVTGLIKAILGKLNVAFSATIGNKDVFGYETGIRGPMFSAPSPFSGANARIYMPSDTPDLAVRNVKRDTKLRVVKRMVRAAKHFAKQDQRSLFVTISNDERALIMKVAEEEGLDAISYGNGTTAKEMAIAFRNGQGEALVGTAANYAEGVDLPKQVAPVIWFLRPAYPRPDDPLTQFEEKRFGRNRSWARWQYKAIIQALQVRGRNIRGTTDLGVTFFISQQFRKFVFGSLPKELQNKAYRGQFSFDECLKDASELLK
jgi:Rad3-related DNA helicase